MNNLCKWLGLLSFSFLVACGGETDSLAVSNTPITTTPDSVNINGLPTLASIYAYQNSENAEQLVSCAGLFWQGRSCLLSDVQPLGIESGRNISIDEIRTRLVVSHDWMAESFIDALIEIDDQDFLNLFKPVNSIVISYEVIPSFYHLYTASIYIDPRYLWRNSEEWQSIYQLEDYRSDYADTLSFTNALRYVDQHTSDYILWSNSYDASYYLQRSSSQLAPGVFQLLAHELAHANDYLSPDTLDYIKEYHGDYASDAYSTIYNYLGWAGIINEEFSASYALTSELLAEAAQITYGGMSANTSMQNLSGAQAGLEFADDGAASLYSYYHDAEDVAMLFEAFMMYKKYGAVSDVAFVTLPEQATSCDDYMVQWGQRNRLGDELVRDRALWIASKILQRDDVQDDLAGLAQTTIAMQTGIGWCASQYDTTDSAPTLRLMSQQASQPGEQSAASVVHNYLDDFIQQH